MPKYLIVFLAIIPLIFNSLLSLEKYPDRKIKNQPSSIIFISSAEYPGQILNCLKMAESIRKFAGSMKGAPIRIYISERLHKENLKYQEQYDTLSVETRFYQAPNEALKFLLGGKVFAAAQAESEAENEAEFLAYLAPNTIIIKEPCDFKLTPGKKIAFSPVHHQNIGSLYNESPDTFWSRLFQILNIPQKGIFPMESLADKKVLRPYFNAGSFVVRPKLHLMKKWLESFKILYLDPVIAKISQKGKHNTFLHQAALAGAIMKLLERKEMVRLPDIYNYPIFFEKFYGAELKFDSINSAISLRYEFDFKNLPDDWDKKIKGPEEVISWIKKHFSPETK